MHVLALLAGIIGLVAVWYWRARMARDAAGDVLETANDVRLAIRRFGYRNRTSVHPADAVEDPRLAAAGIAMAVAGMDGPHSRAEIDMMATEARRVFQADGAEATDIAAFGRWIAGQCQTPDEAVRRLTRVVRTKAGPAAAPQLLTLVERVATADGGPLSERASEALASMKRGLGH